MSDNNTPDDNGGANNTPDDNEGAQQDPSGASGPQPTPPPQQGSAISRVINHLVTNKLEAALWMCRLFTIGNTFNFFLPIFGGNVQTAYQRGLISNAATSALRLHQRLPPFKLSREFATLVFLEDSAHYLFYSMIFLGSSPITMSLVPVFLFALLHATSTTKQILNQVGPTSIQVVRNLILKIEAHQRNILRFIACNEIFLMPAIFFAMFTGSASLLLPFVYYKFLGLRYASRRNPYCRQLFYELRMTAEFYSSKPACPAFLRSIVFKFIGFISRMAPQVQAQ